MKLPEPLPRAEALRLLDAPNTNCPTGLRNRCMLELMYRAGLRVGEVCALRPRDVDDDEGIVRVWAGKGGDGTSYFPPHELQPWLGEWRRVRRRLPRGETLFCTLDGGPVSVRYMQAMVKRMAKRARLEGRVHCHRLRHSFATELLAQPDVNIREVQQALRHKRLETTMRYTFVLDTDLKRKIQRPR